MKKIALYILLLSTLFTHESKFNFNFFEKSSAVMFLIDPNNGDILEANRASTKFYGFSQEELESMKIMDLNTFTPIQIQEEMSAADKEDRNYFLFRHRTKNSGIKRVEVYSSPVVYNNKKVLFSVIHDADNVQENEDALNYYNANLEEQVDITTQELLETEKVINNIIIVALLVQGVIIVLLLINIKRRKEVEKELNITLETLEERVEKAVEKAKDQELVIYEQRKSIAMNELLLNLSHQWRQPLNVISLHAGSIIDSIHENDFSQEDIENSLNKIIKETKGLSSSITLLQTTYKKDDSIISEISTVIDKVEELIGKHFKSAGITIEKKIDNNISLHLKESDLIEIFIALLYNIYEIVKVRELGSAVVTIEVKIEDGKAVISFMDNAGGFDKSLLPDAMFNPYTTTNFKSRDKGLGLYVLKNIVVSQLGGKVYGENKDLGAKITILVDDYERK